MTTQKTEKIIRCHDDCLQSGCPTHTVELQVQTTSDWFTYIKDGKRVFSMDTTEMRNLVKMINELNYL